jgi:hypothetical protein
MNGAMPHSIIVEKNRYSPSRGCRNSTLKYATGVSNHSTSLSNLTLHRDADLSLTPNSLDGTFLTPEVDTCLFDYIWPT